MNNKGMVPVWIFGDQKIDGKASKKYSYTENGVSLRFRDAGEYTVEVKAYNANGLSQGSLVKTFTLDNTYRDPFDPSPYVKAVSGGESQDWVWNSGEGGHFGCGPVGDPLAWWSCDANGKSGFLYDDVMTFDADGNYTFRPGDGQAYANTGSEYMPEYNTGEDYLFPAEEKTTKYTFENNWNDAGIEEIFLVLDPGSILSYVPHKSAVEEPRFQVLETKQAEMKKKLKLMSTVYTPNNADGISWYYEFVPKGAGAADPLFGVESKVWVLDNESAGYMGCGPDFGNSGGWWSAGPHEKDSFGLVDDEITFFANGKYVFDPGENGMVYCNWESGWRPDGYYSGDGSTDYDAPAERMESNYILGSDELGDYIEIPAGVLYGYIAKPQVLSETNRLYIKELTPNSSTDKIVAGLNTELQLWDGLKFRNSLTLDLSYVYGHSYTEQYFLTSKSYSLDTVSSTTTYDAKGNPTTVDKINYGSSASQTMNRYYSYQVENTLVYDKTFGRHTFNVVLGQSAYMSSSSYLGASSRGLMYPDDPWKISVDNTLGKQVDGDRNGWGRWNSIPYSILSYFGRITYNFDERFLAQATCR